MRYIKCAAFDGRIAFARWTAEDETGGEVIAFTIGEPLNPDTYVVHIEKAYAEIQGAYPMINQQFVEHVAQEYMYVNREEDTGAEGLRKAKLSYRPAFLVEKGNVTLRKESGGMRDDKD